MQRGECQHGPLTRNAWPAWVSRTRVDRATLLRRVWGVDALKCPRCEGAMKFIATIHDRAVIVRILAHLRLPTDEMLPAPTRRWDDTS